ncbi:MAG: class I SAM-dependent methyltransferase, partial [Planctomycetota bacterium]
FTPDRCITKNAAGGALNRRLKEALALPFSHIHVQASGGDLHVRITRKGKALVSRGKPSRPDEEPSLEHDRQKEHLLPAGEPDPFLQAVGIMTEAGAVRPSMQAKFRQVNEFLRVIEQMVAGKPWAEDGVQVVDCGCGKAYLTFAACHYLRQVRGLPVRIVGVDAKEELIEEAVALRDALGWSEVEFHAAGIREFEPPAAPDVVLSLHACDTATDEAIARGVLWQSRVILAAPCCQHELHRQLKAPALQPLTRHGILRERLADLVTDAFRALALRIMGYRTSVIEFVEPEATAKNLMIRAERRLKPGHRKSVREYRDLKQFWQVTPRIEELLGEEFRTTIGEA